mmetsp:Transcript_8264/g.51483  ORF Transcript_8264/g.51483 Transcript_8264/m.51483 type:complete len:202 (-) Transcript_8264:1793-2398(-)
MVRQTHLLPHRKAKCKRSQPSKKRTRRWEKAPTTKRVGKLPSNGSSKQAIRSTPSNSKTTIIVGFVEPWKWCSKQDSPCPASKQDVPTNKRTSATHATYETKVIGQACEAARGKNSTWIFVASSCVQAVGSCCIVGSIRGASKCCGMESYKRASPCGKKDSEQDAAVPPNPSAIDTCWTCWNGTSNPPNMSSNGNAWKAPC